MRPVTIKSVGFVRKSSAIKKGKHRGAILTDGLKKLPCKLNEGETVDFLVEENLVDKKEVRYFVAYDATGRQFKGKLKDATS